LSRVFANIVPTSESLGSESIQSEMLQLQPPTENENLSDVVDFEAAAKTIPLGPDNVRQLAELLLTECSTMLEEIEAGIASSDAKRVQRGAHTIRGSAELFAAQHVVSAALDLEDMSRNGRLENAPAALLKLNKEIELLNVAIRAEISPDRALKDTRGVVWRQ
jgi:HPt (histidine-containing phosphotransfer) domain-containing protein